MATFKQATLIASSLHSLPKYQMKYSFINSQQNIRYKIKIKIKHKDRVTDEPQEILKSCIR